MTRTSENEDRVPHIVFLKSIFEDKKLCSFFVPSSFSEDATSKRDPFGIDVSNFGFMGVILNHFSIQLIIS